MSTTSIHRCLIIFFLLLLASVPVLQVVGELRSGEAPVGIRLFREVPTRQSLAAFERQLEDENTVAQTLRPWMQAAQFLALRDGGEKVLVGRDGWLFYGPGVSALTQRPQPGEGTVPEALSAVLHFREALAARGIRLLVVPVPNKESIHPERLSFRSSPPRRVLNPELRAFLAGCAAVGVECLDLHAVFLAGGEEPCYLAQDTHWSPYGMRLAAEAVAARVGMRGGERFSMEPVRYRAHGDLLRMCRSPLIEAKVAPETVTAMRITTPVDDIASPVLVLGDSFCRIYQNDTPGNSGFIAHLARALGLRVASIVNDGGGATLVRQELVRRPELLEGKKIVIWVFTERDLRLAQEGWQTIPLP